jgi:hypothetical protein
MHDALNSKLLHVLSLTDNLSLSEQHHQQHHVMPMCTPSFTNCHPACMLLINHITQQCVQLTCCCCCLLLMLLLALDPCKGTEGGGIATPPAQAYTSTFYAHYSRGKLTILSTDTVTLTSDINQRGKFYYVPNCLSLEVYADTIIIDRQLNITGPRSARFFARSMLCLGADRCVVDASGYDGRSYAGRVAPHGARGLAPGEPDNKEFPTENDIWGNGQVGSKET